MSTNFEEFTQRLEKMRDDYKTAVKTDGENVIKGAAKEIFAAHPELKAIRWYQYTPYFNDGDTCVFSFSHMEFMIGDTVEERRQRITETEDGIEDLQGKLKAAELKSDHRACVKFQDELEKLEEILEGLNDPDADDDDEDWVDDYQLFKYKGNKRVPIAGREELTSKLKAFEKMVSGLDDALMIIFDDHAQITIRRDSDTIENVEYDHD